MSAVNASADDGARSDHAVTRQERFLAKSALAANAILTAGAAASGLTLVNFFYRYGWTREREFSSGWAMLAHYVGPALLSGVLIAALWLKREYRTNLAIVCVALLLSVYGGEAVLRFIEPPLFGKALPVMDELRRSDDRRKLAAALAKQFGVEVDPRNGLEVVADLRANGVDAVRTVLPSLQLLFQEHGGAGTGKATTAQIFALGGVSNALTVLCNESGQYVTYESDEHGFRNAKRLWQAGHLDIVALGDSFTQGYCAPAGKYFVDLIRHQYPATLNLGMTGDGPLLMLATLKEYVPPLRPKLVLWFYFEGNDLLDLRDERRSALLMRYLEDRFRQELPHRQGEVDRVFREFMKREEAWEKELRQASVRNRRGIIGRAIDFVALPRVRARLGLLVGRSKQESELASALNDVELFRQILLRAKATVGSWGGTLDFVYLPDGARFMPRYAFDRRLAKRQHDTILKIATDLGIPVIDVLPTFEAQREPLSLFPFRGPGHYAEDGHRLVAEEVLNAIARSGLFGVRGVIAGGPPPGSTSVATGRSHAAPGSPATAIDRRKHPGHS
jgi:hypothetical protein